MQQFKRINSYQGARRTLRELIKEHRMSELWISFLTSLVGGSTGIGLVVFGLSKWLGDVWKERIRRLEDIRLEIKTIHEQGNVDERLKRLEQDYDEQKTKGEYFHQVTLDTYQEIFKKKIAIYDELTRLKSSYINNSALSDSLRNNEEFANREYYDKNQGIENFALLLQMYEFTLSSQLYVSTGLINNFSIWINKISDEHSKYISSIDPSKFEDLEGYLKEYTGDNLKMKLIDIDGRSTYTLREFIKDIMNQIDKDIEIIKRKHDF